ncbi:MAG: hypothetical protein PHP52_14060 [Bacteroidales bacterium]|nr:hypothetical protein [Bacteroidales bacterium]
MRHFKRNNNSLKIGLSLFASLILIFIGFWLNVFIVKPDYSFLIFAILKTVCLSLSIVSLLLLSFFIYKSTSNKTINNLSISFVSILSFFLIFEIIFSFYTPSTNVFTDLSNQIWIKRYAQEKNSLGYRDEEPVDQSGKKNILVIGDSFVAGHGVKYDEMFVNILKNELTDNYNLFNLGVSGSHTDREFDSLLTYPIKPDIIVLCYYHNDIESAMIEHNFSPKIKNPKDKLSNISKFFVDNSLLLNFLFSLNAKKSISSQFMES